MSQSSSTLVAEDYSEINEWIDAINSVVKYAGIARAELLLQHLLAALSKHQHVVKVYNTPYCNTISQLEQSKLPDQGLIAKQASAAINWNAIAMVVNAANKYDGLGGHISTYASSCVLYDIGFNHFFKARNHSQLEDCVFVQGHASPGIYARAFLEGRLTAEQLGHFRKECKGKGVSSYPHPFLMPDFWQFPTVSMGLGPLSAVYHARFIKYLINRGFIIDTKRKVWAFCGDGEVDEPETLSATAFASYEGLDNLIFVVNCNLQRLDGLVRSAGSIVTELESKFLASGWCVIKVVFNSAWDKLFAKDTNGVLIQALGECIDGQFQRFSYGGGKTWREEFFNTKPELKALIAGMSDADLDQLNWGGHDPAKVFAAYHAATHEQKVPTAILVQTTKGYGVPGAAGFNTAHNVKKLSAEVMQQYAKQNNLNLSAQQAADCDLLLPEAITDVQNYLLSKRESLGGFLPKRYNDAQQLLVPELDYFASILSGSGDRSVSSTMAFVRVLSLLLKNKDVGKHIVPIVADESRTFGMEGLFRQVGIYNRHGQEYCPVDRDQVMYYREATDGQLLQEGLNEAGSLSSWLAAATSYSHSNVAMMPFYIFYSMFGFQRVGDAIWAAGDSRARGFLIGATSGRTSLAGEGLQHADGHSHILASTVPNCRSYDPTYGYEVATIIQHGMQRMLVEQQDEFYYLTVVNENIQHIAMPAGVADGIVKGMYLLETLGDKAEVDINLLSCGAILPEAISAARMLVANHGCKVNVWSVTSFNELARNGMQLARQELLEPEAELEQPYVSQCLIDASIPVVAVTDYMRAYAEQIRPYIKADYTVLGTDGFGRSDDRENMRWFFEVDANMIAYTACVQLFKANKLSKVELSKAKELYNIDVSKLAPMDC